ncbi:type VI secretion system baseplate subunit TssG [Robbsia sp. Bb-Pol-6]|uniref:Type VI secretion system baseplate subunit TssG n=1 Tax=Robbsia betulipollinis TaxID=2981849 RepID=A0ABT3ZKC1_9BURK|nr:type VI secretion system baseplate subunit TssG [Robbsia betulipollinis]
MIDHLLRSPQRFNLFRAISLLEQHARPMQTLGMADGRNERVRLSGCVSLAFPSSDVRSIADVTAGDGAPRYVLSTAALTLAGGQGPLPLVITEKVIQRSAARDCATADFLDIFNHRFLCFLYRSRKKHAPALHGHGDADSPIASCIDAIANLGRGSSPRHPAPWLRHAGLMGGAPRSMVALLAILGDRLKVRVRGTQFVGGWHRLDPHDASRLHGGGARLDGSRALGMRAWDRSAGIGIECAMLTPAQLEDLLPGGDRHALMTWLIRRYVQTPLDIHLCLRLAPAQPVAPGRLGVTRLRLGWTTWLGRRVRSAAETPAPTRLRFASDERADRSPGR